MDSNYIFQIKRTHRSNFLPDLDTTSNSNYASKTKNSKCSYHITLFKSRLLKLMLKNALCKYLIHVNKVNLWKFFQKELFSPYSYIRKKRSLMNMQIMLSIEIVSKASIKVNIKCKILLRKFTFAPNVLSKQTEICTWPKRWALLQFICK